jgi:hypothetical protein
MPILGQRWRCTLSDGGKVSLCILGKSEFEHLDHPCGRVFLDRSRQVCIEERGEVGRSGWFAWKVKYGRVRPPRKSDGFRFFECDGTFSQNRVRKEPMPK